MNKKHPPTKKQVDAALNFYAAMAKKPSSCFAEKSRLACPEIQETPAPLLKPGAKNE